MCSSNLQTKLHRRFSRECCRQGITLPVLPGVFVRTQPGKDGADGVGLLRRARGAGGRMRRPRWTWSTTSSRACCRARCSTRCRTRTSTCHCTRRARTRCWPPTPPPSTCRTPCTRALGRGARWCWPPTPRPSACGAPCARVFGARTVGRKRCWPLTPPPSACRTPCISAFGWGACWCWPPGSTAISMSCTICSGRRGPARACRWWQLLPCCSAATPSAASI